MNTLADNDGDHSSSASKYEWLYILSERKKCSNGKLFSPDHYINGLCLSIPVGRRGSDWCQ